MRWSVRYLPASCMASQLSACLSVPIQASRAERLGWCGPRALDESEAGERCPAAAPPVHRLHVGNGELENVQDQFGGEWEMCGIA